MATNNFITRAASLNVAHRCYYAPARDPTVATIEDELDRFLATPRQPPGFDDALVWCNKTAARSLVSPRWCRCSSASQVPSLRLNEFGARPRHPSPHASEHDRSNLQYVVVPAYQTLPLASPVLVLLQHCVTAVSLPLTKKLTAVTIIRQEICLFASASALARARLNETEPSALQVCDHATVVSQRPWRGRGTLSLFPNFHVNTAPAIPMTDASSREGAFIDACETGKLDDVRRLLHDKADPNTRSSNRLFVLHLASNSGHLEVARLLLDLSATVDARDSADFTPMHYAAYHGHIDVVQLLLDRRADADAVGSNGSSPLHLASAGDHKNVAELLLSRGVDAGRRNVRIGLEPT